MTCKDSFLMLTKEQKKSGRVYLTEGQLKFLKSKIGVESEQVAPIGVPDLSPPQKLTVKAYDDSNDRIGYNFELTNILVYKIVSYCKQNKIKYIDFFEELLKHSPADKQEPSTSTTISSQLKDLSLIRMKDIEMAEKGFISAAKADLMLGCGKEPHFTRGQACRGVIRKELKCTRYGKLMYFLPSDVEKYAKTLKKKV